MRVLPPRRSRVFVLVLVGLALLLAAVSTIAILRGWEDRELQDRLREVRRERGQRI